MSCSRTSDGVFLSIWDDITGILKATETLPGHSSGLLARLRWTRRRLSSQGGQHGIRSHLDARQEELGLTAEDKSLLDQLLRKSQPPERDVEFIDTTSSIVIKEKGELEASMKEGGFSLGEIK